MQQMYQHCFIISQSQCLLSSHESCSTYLLYYILFSTYFSSCHYPVNVSNALTVSTNVRLDSQQDIIQQPMLHGMVSKYQTDFHKPEEKSEATTSTTEQLHSDFKSIAIAECHLLQEENIIASCRVNRTIELLLSLTHLFVSELMKHFRFQI
jgi:hypothetical protein